MSKDQTLRALVNERLAAAAEDIFVLFERTIAEYEEELCRSKEENQRKQQLLDLSPGIELPTAGPGRAPVGCEFIKMSKGQTLRASVKERLAAEAEDIVVLFEKTIAEHEEELSRSKEENQRKPQLLDNGPSPRIELVTWNFLIPSMSLGPGLNQEITQSPQEQSVKQEEKQLPVSVPESSAVCVKTEESSLLQQRQTENASDTDSCPETEAAGDHYNQVQIRDRRYKLAPKDKNHQCSICGKTYITKQHLDVHIRTHTGERPYSCTVCKKTFNLKGTLKNHSRTHTGEKPYWCHICLKSFTQKGTLTTHYRKHTGEKPYSCTVCERAYTTKCALDYHRKTHSREKPYSCSICKKRFVVKSNLGRHRQTHLGEEPQSCLT